MRTKSLYLPYVLSHSFSRSLFRTLKLENYDIFLFSSALFNTLGFSYLESMLTVVVETTGVVPTMATGVV